MSVIPPEPIVVPRRTFDFVLSGSGRAFSQSVRADLGETIDIYDERIVFRTKAEGTIIVYRKDIAMMAEQTHMVTLPPAKLERPDGK